jgi:lipopolysaccharide exporter
VNQGTDRTDDAAPTLERSKLKEATLSGIRWVTIGRVAAEVVGFASLVALARLIPPAEFGRAAVALILKALAIALVSESFGTVLVQRRTVTRAHLQSAVLLSIGAGTLLAAATMMLAVPVLSGAFGRQTAELIQLGAPMFVIAAVAVVPHALLQRKLDFARISLAEVASIAVGAAVSVGLAVGGLDAEAIVLGAIAKMLVSSLLLFVFAPPPPPRWNRDAFHDITSFGLPATGSALLFTAVRNVDYAILAMKLSAAQVGYYYRAFQLGVQYQNKVSIIMRRIALPIYSRAAGLEDMRMLRGRIVRMHSTLIFPVLGLFIAVAPVMIPWLFGPQWEPSVLPAQILAVMGMSASVGTGTGPLILAAGKPRELLVYNVVHLALYAVTVYVTASYGLTAVCVGVLTVHMVTLIGGQYFLVQRLIGIPLRTLAVELRAPGIATMALLAVALPLARVLDAASPPIAICVTALGAGTVYLLMLRVLFPSTWGDLNMVVRRVLAPKRRRFAASKQPLADSPATVG